MPKKEVSKNDKKEKKENKHFFKDFKAELKRVIWPTPKQLVNNTVAVIVIVIITAIIVFVLDVTFELVNKQGINRVKEFVETHKEQTDADTKYITKYAMRLAAKKDTPPQTAKTAAKKKLGKKAAVIIGIAAFATAVIIVMLLSNDPMPI